MCMLCILRAAKSQLNKTKEKKNNKSTNQKHKGPAACSSWWASIKLLSRSWLSVALHYEHLHQNLVLTWRSEGGCDLTSVFALLSFSTWPRLENMFSSNGLQMQKARGGKCHLSPCLHVQTQACETMSVIHKLLRGRVCARTPGAQQKEKEQKDAWKGTSEFVCDYNSVCRVKTRVLPSIGLTWVTPRQGTDGSEMLAVAMATGLDNKTPNSRLWDISIVSS